MNIIEIYKLQKNVVDTIYKIRFKCTEVNEDLTDEEIELYLEELEELEKFGNTLIDMRNNSKVKFWLATVITNLNINVWRKAFSIRKMNKRFMQRY